MISSNLNRISPGKFNLKKERPGLGAIVTAQGVAYRVWAPKVPVVQVEICQEGFPRSFVLQRSVEGYHCGLDILGQAGDLYRYSIEGQGSFPDPASRAQDKDVHGWSVVIDPNQFQWTDENFRRAPFRDLVIYELHAGTFTPEGTFQAAIERLPYLRELGITAIEIMPIADFPGMRNWGYDGVLLFAPARCYGRPDDLRALVDAAHGLGIAVILDVVYNHFGPDGNYLARFSDHYFNEKHHTPWGAALNFDGPSSQPVREFFLANPVYWMEEFHIDGFRVDAAHEIIDDSETHILAELTDAIHDLGGFVVAEDERNDFRMITSVQDGGFGFDGVWADDFHHTTRVRLTGEQAAYFANFGGSSAEIAKTLARGWLYCGEAQKTPATCRGTDGSSLPPERFIHCISNHDQVGNRALGERLHQLCSPEAYRALSALLCLSPYTPLFFMGQEWRASTPFLFFTDHTGELGRQITEGRRKEFSSFEEFNEPSEQKSIPDPQSLETFQNSKLIWAEVQQPEHREILDLYKESLKIRAKYPALRPVRRDTWTVKVLEWDSVAIQLAQEDTEFLVLFDLSGGHAGCLPDPEKGGIQWELIFSSEDKRYGGAEMASFDGVTASFSCPALLLFQATQ